MSEIKKQIEEINKAAKKSRRINNTLWGFIVVLVGVALYLAYDATVSRGEAREAEQRALDSEKIALANETKAIEAQQKLEENINSAREVLWNNAVTSNTVASYSYYYSIYGKDENFDKLQEKMDALFRDNGYVQILDSDGRTEYFKVTRENDLGKFYMAVGDRNVNTGVLYHPDFPNAKDKIGHTIRQGQVVKFMNEYKSGDAIWAQVEYTRR